MQLPLAKEKLDQLKKDLEFVEVVIVDEMSMVSAYDLYNLNKRLQEIFDSKGDFGGRALLLVGDLLQLPPVRAQPIFKKPRCQKNKVWCDMKDEKNSAIGELWQNCEVVVLKTNFRQGEGNPWTELLNRVRIGESTADDIKILEERSYELLSNEAYDNAINIFFTNIEVLEHNVYKLSTLKTDLAKSKVTYQAPKGSGYIPFVNERGLIDNTNFNMDLELKIGARVMIIFNVNIPDSLVNGALGTIIDIIFDSVGRIEAVIVKLDNPKAGLDQMKEYNEISEKYVEKSGCPIFSSTTEYHISHKRKRNKNHGATCKVTQFPLR